MDIVCDTVKKCLGCNRIITGKYVNNLKVERYLLVKLKFNCNSMSYQATEESAVK